MFVQKDLVSVGWNGAATQAQRMQLLGTYETREGHFYKRIRRKGWALIACPRAARREAVQRGGCTLRGKEEMGQE